MDRSLLVRVPNWIGDCLMALPTLEALAERVPLRLVGRGWAPDLLAGHGWPVAALAKGVRADAALLRGERTAGAGPWALLLTHSLSSAGSARLAGFLPIGYRRDFRGPLLARSLPWPAELHEARRYWRLGQLAAETLGLPPLGSEPPGVRLRLHDRHRDQAAAALAAAGVTGPYLALCPLATGLVHGRPKQWPGFPDLTRALAGRTLVATAPADRAGDLAAALPGAVILPALSTGAFAALLAGAERVIANDSGPMHLAAATGARTIGVFGISDPRRTGAWGGDFTPLGGPEGWPTVEAVRAAVN